MILPQKTTTKLGPGAGRASPDGTTRCLGGPFWFGSVVKQFFVFCVANGKLSVTLLLELAEAITDFLVADDIVRSIHLACDRLRLFPQRQFIRIKGMELRWCRLDRLHNGVC